MMTMVVVTVKVFSTFLLKDDDGDNADDNDAHGGEIYGIRCIVLLAFAQQIRLFLSRS